MKKLLILVTILGMGGLMMAQTSELRQTIRGSVTDAVTGYPVAGAYIILSGSNPVLGTATGINGRFELGKVPVGRITIQISCLGYEPKNYSNLLLVSGKELVIDVQLEEKATSIGEVVVKPRENKAEAINELAMVSTRTFSVEETERFAGSLGDPARMVANYAGVMTQNDSRNDIIIRGNSPTGVLWRIDGIEIPNPNHFGAQGTTGGPVSMVNNNLLSNSDFLTGAFPAEYGNAIAGAFDLNLRSGNTEKHEFTGQVGFNGFELAAEGPMFKTSQEQKASYLASFRYSTLEVIGKLGLSAGTGTAIPEYKDLTFVADIPTAKAGKFRFTGLFGKSFIALGRDLTDTSDNAYNARGIANDYGSDMGVAGLTHTYYFNPSTRIKSSISWQYSGSEAMIDSVKNSVFVPYIRSNQNEKKLSFATQLRKKFSSSDNLSAGITIDRYDIAYLDSLNDRDYHRFITATDINGSMMLYRGYAQWQHRSGARMTSYTGINLQYSGLNKEIAVEPRLGFNYMVSEKGTINAGFGLHSQMQPKVVYFYQEYNPATDSYSMTNEKLGFSRSAHFIAGYQYLPGNNLRIKAEAYFQHLYRIPVKESFPEFSLINSGDQFGIPREDSLISKGKGRNYGMEFTFEKFLSKGWYILFTTSVFNSQYTGYDGKWRNTAFNGNYVLNLLGGYEHRLGKNTSLTVDLKTVWAGGKRYTPVNIESSLASGEEVREWSAAYRYKYGDYFRTDLRLGLRYNNRKFSQEWGIDLQNITGYRSIFMEAWDGDKAEMYQIYQQGFLPMFLYRIRF